MLAAIATLALAAALPSRSDAKPLRLTVESDDVCVVKERVGQRLADVLSSSVASDFSVFILARKDAENATRGELRILDDEGSVLVERRFSLKRGDCERAPDLFHRVVAEFFEHLPAKARVARTQEAVPSPEIIERITNVELSEIAAELTASLASRWLPANIELELGAGMSVGSGLHRLVAESVLRVGAPRSLGDGQYIESMGLLGVGWSYRLEGFLFRLSARAGTVLVSGFDFDRDMSAWLPWFEGHGSVLRDFDAFRMGLELACSPLPHHITTRDETDSATVSPLRIGLTAAFPLWSEKF